MVESSTSTILECGTIESSLEGSPLKKVPNGQSSKLSFGLGIEIDSGAQSTLILEPTVAYTLRPVFESFELPSDANNELRLLDIGLRVGVFFD